MTKSKQNQTLLASIGQRIAEVRKKVLHLSQEKLADQVGVKLRTIQRYEADETLAPESFFQRLSEINKLINMNWIKTGIGGMYNISDVTTNFSVDYEVYMPVKEGDCKRKLQLAIAEINMLRAAIIYKDSLLNVLVNQTVIS